MTWTNRLLFGIFVEMLQPSLLHHMYSATEAGIHWEVNLCDYGLDVSIMMRIQACNALITLHEKLRGFSLREDNRRSPMSFSCEVKYVFFSTARIFLNISRRSKKLKNA